MEEKRKACSENAALKTVVERVKHMERCYDLLCAAAEHPERIRTEPSLAALLQLLLRYYEGGQWLADYELDEQGVLPRDLKRGVLSQDGVYNLLETLNDTGESIYK